MSCHQRERERARGKTQGREERKLCTEEKEKLKRGGKKKDPESGKKESSASKLVQCMYDKKTKKQPRTCS